MDVLDFGDRETNRPLGLGRPRPPRREPRPIGLNAALLMVLAVVTGGSIATALHREPFRSPPPVAVTTPQAAPVEEPRESQEQERPATGPSITRVGPPRSGDDGSSVVVVRDPSGLSQNLALAHLPEPELIEQSDYGPLPMISASGRRPFDAYRRQAGGTGGPRVAIVVSGLGLSQTGTQRAIELLPSDVTLAFSAHGNSLTRWMQTARREGHELYLQVPMEPYDYPNVDPGRDTLLAEGPDFPDTLYRSLGRMTNYAGVMNHMGGRYLADAQATGRLMTELAERGLAYLDDGSSARSVAAAEAARHDVPFAQGTLTLDAVRERGAVLERLADLEAAARAGGSAIGTAAAFDVSVEAIASWAADARSRGITVVPVSSLAADAGRR